MTVALLSASTLPFQIAFMMCSAFTQDQESRRVPPLLQERGIAAGLLGIYAFCRSGDIRRESHRGGLLSASLPPRPSNHRSHRMPLSGGGGGRWSTAEARQHPL